MKKIFMLLMIGILLAASVAMAEDKPTTIQSMTELGDIQKKLDQGLTIGKAYYTSGYGFSTSEFTTDDPDEIEQLWQAVNAITVGQKVDEFITDWYPQIVFYLTDGTYGCVCFDAEWLSVDGMGNYEISNAEGFWNLTAALVEKHAETEQGTVPGGWNEPVDGGWGTASDPTITDEVRALFEKALDGLVGVNYVPVTYLGTQVVAGYNHIAITDIRDLNW